MQFPMVNECEDPKVLRWGGGPKGPRLSRAQRPSLGETRLDAFLIQGAQVEADGDIGINL